MAVIIWRSGISAAAGQKKAGRSNRKRNCSFTWGVKAHAGDLIWYFSSSSSYSCSSSKSEFYRGRGTTTRTIGAPLILRHRDVVSYKVSGVRREKRKSGNPKPDTLYETSWNDEWWLIRLRRNEWWMSLRFALFITNKIDRSTQKLTAGRIP